MSEKVGVRRIAHALGLTERRVNQLVTEGVLSAEGKPAKYDFDETIQAYIAFAVENAKGRGAGDAEAEKKKLQADADYKRAKADQEALKLAELEGRMHSAEDVESAVTALVYSVRSMLLAVPGRVAVDAARCKTAQEISALLQAEMSQVLDSLSEYEYDPEVYAQMVRERKGWIAANDEDEEAGDS